MIKNLIFDFGKVLVDYDYMTTLVEIFDTEADALDFLQRFVNGGWAEKFDREDKPVDEIIADMQREMPEYASQIVEFDHRYTSLVTGEIEGMAALLTRLKGEGYKLYGLTNWCSRVRQTMKQYTIFNLLDGWVISSDEHIIKPDLRIYKCICDRYGLVPAECVFTDDREENVKGAEQFGIKAILFTSAKQYEHDLQEIIEHS